jgi:hypothetical protein
MAMEVLTQPQHIKVSGRFYVAQFFDRETQDVLAGAVPDVSPDPAAPSSWTRQPARPPCNGSREISTNWCLVTRNFRGRLSQVEGEAGAAHMKARPASLSPQLRIDIAAPE